MTIQRQLAKTILESMYEDLEARVQSSSYSPLAQHAGNATIVLGFDECLSILRLLSGRDNFFEFEYGAMIGSADIVNIQQRELIHHQAPPSSRQSLAAVGPTPHSTIKPRPHGTGQSDRKQLRRRRGLSLPS